MKWLKSPWFWLVIVAVMLLLWWLFFGRSPARTTKKAPSSIGGSGQLQGWNDIINSIGSAFSSGESIMAEYRSS